MDANSKPAHPAFANVPDISERPSSFGTAKINPPGAKTEEERDAAWARLVKAMNAGWRSDGSKMTRDEMHERGDG